MNFMLDSDIKSRRHCTFLGIFLSFIRCFQSTRTWIKGAEFGIWYRDIHFVLRPKKANLLKIVSRIIIIKNKCYVLFEKRNYCISFSIDSFQRSRGHIMYKLLR